MAQYPPPGPSRYPQDQGSSPLPGYTQPGQPGYGLPPPVQQRRGCRGCLFGCLGTVLAVGAIVVVMMVAGYFLFKRAFPTTESFNEAASCSGLRIGLLLAESTVERGDLTPDEKAQAQKQLQTVRAEFERRCGPAQ